MNYKEYAPDWKDVIRPTILKRDNYKCAVCGAQHRARVYKLSNGAYQICDEFTEEWAKANNKKVFTLYLQVAHLDHNKQNNDPANLKTLCPFHHAKNDAEHKKFSRIIYRKKIIQEKKNLDPLNLEERRQLKLNVKKWIREETGVNVPLQQIEELFKIIES
jgi:5-methylcytosine-specific restriction endonuclease McrA